MRKQLKDYIKENIVLGGTSYNEREVKEFQTWWERIEKDCKPWLNEIRHGNSGGQLVYRGIKTAKGDFELRDVRKDRYPKDTSIEWHNALDDAFKSHFGWKARSEGLFVSHNKTADSYGDVYIVFPVGKYRYLWSESYDDLYSYVSDYEFSPSDDTVREWERDWENEYGEGNSGSWWYDGNDTGDSDIDDAIDSVIQDIVEKLRDEIGELDPEEDEDEIQNYQDQIEDAESKANRIVIKRDMEWEPEVSLDDYMNDIRDGWFPSEEELYEEADSIIRSGRYRTDSLLQGISKRHEVMVDCDKYYVISEEYKGIVNEAVFDPSFDPDQLLLGI